MPNKKTRRSTTPRPVQSRGGGIPLHNRIIVAIPERGLTATWNGEQFIGDEEITRWAQFYAETGHVFELTPEMGDVQCGTGSPNAILASLIAACGGRGVVLGNPPGVDWGIGD